MWSQTSFGIRNHFRMKQNRFKISIMLPDNYEKITITRHSDNSFFTSKQENEEYFQDFGEVYSYLGDPDDVRRIMYRFSDPDIDLLFS